MATLTVYATEVRVGDQITAGLPDGGIITVTSVQVVQGGPGVLVQIQHAGGSRLVAAALQLTVTRDSATVPDVPYDPFPQYLTLEEGRAALQSRWQPNTAYAQGDIVVSPAGQLVSANIAFTSGTTYSASNWTVTAGGNSVVTDALRKKLLATLRRDPAAALPPVTSVATPSWSTTEPTGQTRIGWSDTRTRKSGLIPDPALSAVYAGKNLLIDSGGGYSAHYYEFDHDGTVLSVGLLAQSTGAVSTCWVWVDGAPTTPTPVILGGGGSATASTNYYLTETFAARGRRRVRVYLQSAQVTTVYIAPTDSITPTPKPAVTAMIFGDSFPAQGLAGMYVPLANMLGWDLYLNAQGGTGYVNAPSGSVFGSTTRLGFLTQADPKPDVVLFIGSINDDSKTGVQAAAAAAFAGVATALPGVPVIVIGPQEYNAASTWIANHFTNNEAVKAAALAAPNVIGFRATTGATSVPPAWATGTTYAVGDRVLSKGAIYRCVFGHSSGGSVGFTPDNIPARWTLDSWLTGTGSLAGGVGPGPKSDGNRDVYLSSDGTHPTLITDAVWSAGVLWAPRIVEAVEGVLVG